METRVDKAEIIEPSAGAKALLIIDMINDLQFSDADAMRPKVLKAAEAILRLRNEADRAGVPTVYVNDNFGQWPSEKSRLVEHVRQADPDAAALADRIGPRPNDYFVIKPQFSGFYATNLPVLLPQLKASRVILTGVAADICVLFTAADAHMRQYDIWVPSDAVASPDDQRTEWALEIMRNAMSAETRATSDLPLGDWLKRTDDGC